MIKDPDRQMHLLCQERLLGKGSFGKVFLAESKRGDYAVKHVNDENIMGGEGLDDLKNEERILKVANREGPVEGVQAAVMIKEVRDLSSESGAKGFLALGKVYTGGDLQKNVDLRRLAMLAGVDVGAFEDPAHTPQLVALSFRHNLSELNEEALWEIASGLNMCVTTFLGKEISHEFMKKFRDLSDNLQAPVKEQELRELLAVMCMDIAVQVQGVKAFSLPTLMGFGANVLAGMQYLHREGILHGDIKPLNFFNDGQQALLGDFGGSRLKTDPDLKGVVTTPVYGFRSYTDAMRYYSSKNDQEACFAAGCALDVRAMGVSLYEMFTGGIIPHKAGPEIYQAKKEEMVALGLPQRAAAIIAKMAMPVEFDAANPCESAESLFSATPEEVAELERLLRGDK